MIKVIAIGDIHADFPKLWRALKNSFAVGEGLSPSEPLLQGRYKVVLMGDLAHPKTHADYRKITGFEDYDPENPGHLRIAAKAQIRELNRIKRFQEAAPQHISILMGNHDHAILTGDFILGNAHLEHKEFHPELGGVELPEDLKTWIGNFPAQVNLFGVNFAHVGPVPWLQSYDALFYEGREAKEWWIKTPDYVERMGHKFGVYGHTVMKNGIQVLDKLAMIDALDQDQYLELILDEDHLDWSICQIPVPSHA
jgi:hypothetical protein